MGRPAIRGWRKYKKTRREKAETVCDTTQEMLGLLRIASCWTGSFGPILPSGDIVLTNRIEIRITYKIARTSKSRVWILECQRSTQTPSLGGELRAFQAYRILTV